MLGALGGGVGGERVQIDGGPQDESLPDHIFADPTDERARLYFRSQAAPPEALRDGPYRSAVSPSSPSQLCLWVTGEGATEGGREVGSGKWKFVHD